MCGIAGQVDTLHGVDPTTLLHMNNIASYRGPDDEGYAFVDNDRRVRHARGQDSIPLHRQSPCCDIKELKGRHVIGFAHRRLSILDVTEAGHQPMCDPASGCLLVFNGEIYNHVEIRQELIGRGAAFSSGSDSEVLLKAYAAWGPSFVSRLNGMWAFALWDPSRGTIMCSRDRLGAKPFHWWTDGTVGFSFASELKQVCQDARVQRNLNKRYLASNIAFGLSDYDDQTLIKSVNTLEAGCNLFVVFDHAMSRIEHIEKESYWSLSVREDGDLHGAFALKRISEEFSRSCSWRLRSDVPVAALLSGGLDSSCLVCEVVDQMEAEKGECARLATYTTSYSAYPDCDESTYAMLVNEAKGCIGHVVEPRPEHIEELFSDLVWHLEGMSNMQLVGSMLLMQKVSSDGYKVVLNGQCSDELMFGYERYYAFYLRDIARRGQLARAWKEYRLACRNSRLTARELLGMLAYFTIPAVRIGRQIKRIRSFCREGIIDSIDMKHLRRLMFPHSLNDLLQTELRQTQLTHITRYDDRISMAASIESRIPFMDYQFVELACSIPPAEKITSGWTKYLVRRAFEGRLPDEVVWRKNKMGFPAPREEWLRRIPDAFILDLLKSPRAESIFDVSKVKRAFHQDKSSRIVETFLWVELFMRRFDVSC